MTIAMPDVRQETREFFGEFAQTMRRYLWLLFWFLSLATALAASSNQDAVLFGQFIQPSFYLDFTQLSSFPSTFAYSGWSAGTGTCANASGAIVSSTGPCFDYSLTSVGLPIGPRIEEARTNLFLNNGSPATQTVVVTGALAYTISFYGTGTLTLLGACTQTMTGSAYPTRTAFTCTTSSTSLVATVTSLGTMSWPQIEAGPFATSPIPTAGASVQRVADSVSFSGASLAPMQTNAGAVIVEVLAGAVNSPNNNLIYSGASGGTSLNMVSSDNLVSAQEFVSVWGTTPNTFALSSTNRAGLSWKNGSQVTVLNGGVPVSTAFSYSASSVGYALGRDSTTGNRYFDGHIEKIAIYPGYLSPNQMQRLSTLGVRLH